MLAGTLLGRVVKCDLTDDGDSRALSSDDATGDERCSGSPGLKEVARNRLGSELPSSTLSPSPKQWTPKKCIALGLGGHFTPPIEGHACSGSV